MRKQSLSQIKYGSSSGKSGELNGDDDKENAQKKAKRDAFGVKRDFFGRIINESLPMSNKDGIDQSSHNRKSGEEQEHKVWVTFHEGFSNAVRKPISLGELLAEL
jgi:chromosome transmission fidelity protein 18